MRSDCRLSFVDTIRSEHVAVLDEAASAVRRRHALPFQRPFAGYRASFDPGRVFSKTLKKLRIIMEEKVNELCEKTRVSIRDVFNCRLMSFALLPRSSFLHSRHHESYCLCLVDCCRCCCSFGLCIRPTTTCRHS